MAREGEYMHRPCPECPFQRDGEGRTPVRLMTGRIREIASNMLSPAGGEFPCHKTVRRDHDGEGCAPGRNRDGERHCAGALIFAEKNENATQMMRIAERIGLYDPTRLEGHDLVFDDVDEWMETAIDRPRSRRRRSRRRR